MSEPDFLKIKGVEIDLTTANTVTNSRVTRLYAPSSALITVANTSGTIGTFTMPSASVEYLIKEPTDTIAANTTVRVAPVSYR